MPQNRGLHSRGGGTAKNTRFKTPIGEMEAIASEEALCLFSFADKKTLAVDKARIQAQFRTPIRTGRNPVLHQLEQDLEAYFQGTGSTFGVPLACFGSSFQERVWSALATIPVGQTWSYQQLAEQVGHVRACRAVANANGANCLSIIIPCHRVIRSDGSVGGYAGGVERKRWLLAHEQKYFIPLNKAKE